MKSFIIILLSCTILGMAWLMNNTTDTTMDGVHTGSTEIYMFTIVDKHELQLTNSNDTITLLLENTHVLVDQNPIIIIKR